MFSPFVFGYFQLLCSTFEAQTGETGVSGRHSFDYLSCLHWYQLLHVVVIHNLQLVSSKRRAFLSHAR